MNRRSFLGGLLALPFLRFFKPKIPANLTLLDVAKRNDRKLLPMVEALSEKNPLLQDMVWKEPAPIGHMYTILDMPARKWFKLSDGEI
jgi:hypothetical protein